MSSYNSIAQKAARILIRKVLKKLKDMDKAGQIGQKLVQKIDIVPPGFIRISDEYQPDWSITAIRVQLDLEETSTFKEFENTVQQDPNLCSRMNTLIGTSSTSTRKLMTCRDLFQILLSKVLHECHNDLEVSDEQVDNIWKSVVQSLVADRTQVKYWCILENVEVPVGTSIIRPGILLRGLRTHEIEELWNQNRIIQDYYPFNIVSRSSSLNVQTILETTVNDDVVVGDSEIDLNKVLKRFVSVRSSFESICTSIRLLQTKRFFMSPIILEVADVWGSSSAHGILDWRVGQVGGKCKLSQKDINEIKKLLKVISQGKSRLSEIIKICLRRIDLVNMRLSPEDRLLDIFMALEALVLPDSGGELSFRLATRMAKFLGQDKKDHVRIYKLILKAYGLRSKVIHGNQLKLKETSDIDELEKLTKEAIRKYLYMFAGGKDGKKKNYWTELLFDQPEKQQ